MYDHLDELEHQSVFILREAYGRYFAPGHVLVREMVAIAVFGLLSNLACGAILYRSSRHSINLRGAFLHVLSDALNSVGVNAAGIVIMMTGWQRADPLACALICVGIVVSSP